MTAPPGSLPERLRAYALQRRQSATSLGYRAFKADAERLEREARDLEEAAAALEDKAGQSGGESSTPPSEVTHG